MTDIYSDKTKITEAVKSAKHSLALEGLKVTPDEENDARLPSGKIQYI
ncbi:antitoxin VbhA family protein [Terrilactibacillus sp. S3-3]|nr:antitoxin VbhA family protein [Terrilactibacillus sp. S3-3]